MQSWVVGFAAYLGAHTAPDRYQHEIDRAKQRFVIGLVVAFLSMFDATTGQHDENLPVLISYAAAIYALSSTLYAFALSKRPEGFAAVQYIYLAIDPVLTVAGLVFAPTYLAPLNFLLMVQIVRCGMRYGTRTLWFSWCFAVVASALALPHSDYWLAHKALLWSFCAVMCFTPLLFVPLIDKLHSMTEELRQAATSDQLTGLGNRRMLSEHLRLARERCIRDASMLAVLYIDLDNFKQVNDTLGHNIGDALLELIAKRLKKNCRSGDFLARVGGDEFVLLVEGLSKQTGTTQAEEIAKKLVATVQDCASEVAPRAGVSASVGIRCWTPDPHAMDHDDLIDEADRAMYSAKRAGKSRVTLSST
jgi:diguanylate cyclase (GGDEF)-like protein